MKTRVIVVGSLCAFGFAGWLALGGGSSASDAPVKSAAAMPSATASAATRTPARRGWFGLGAPTAAATNTQDAPQKLDPRSDRFRNRIDEQIPERLYGEAARCYRGGLLRDQKLDVEYHIHVADGNISITDVRITDTTINNRTLEECVKQKLLASHWRDDELPDLDENDDLYMRVDGWKQYLANADDDSSSNG
jgi:hypothetical protein